MPGRLLSTYSRTDAVADELHVNVFFCEAGCVVLQPQCTVQLLLQIVVLAHRNFLYLVAVSTAVSSLTSYMLHRCRNGNTVV